MCFCRDKNSPRGAKIELRICKCCLCSPCCLLLFSRNDDFPAKPQPGEAVWDQGMLGQRSFAGGRGWICELPLASMTLFPEAPLNPGVFHPNLAKRCHQFPLVTLEGNSASHSGERFYTQHLPGRNLGRIRLCPEARGLDSGGGRSFASPLIPPDAARGREG